MRLSRFFTCLFLAIVAAAPAFAVDTCNLAADIATRAKQTFADNPIEGMKLYIQAQQYCAADPAYNYNLGMAYYRYGSNEDAAEWLKKAVEMEPANPTWSNNLAWVLLKLDKGHEALSFIEPAVQQRPDDSRLLDTRARARFAAGLQKDALLGLNVYRDSDEKLLRDAYEELLETYRIQALQAVKRGDIDEGVKALNALDFEPRAVRDALLILVKTERFDEALQQLETVRYRYPGHQMIGEIIEAALAGKIRKFYQDYQNGQAALAVQDAKLLAAQYPDNPAVTKAYDELLSALLNDAVSIRVPAPMVAAEPAEPAAPGDQPRNADALLAGLGSAGPTDASLSLKVDIDENIPAGNQQRKYGVAVVIGNQNYQRMGKGIGDVRFAGRDAAIMKQYLETTMGFDPKNIIFAMDTTSGDLRNIFGTRENPKGQLQNFVRPGESDVFIYYVGHGAPGPDGKSAYLVPVDAQADYIANNGYPLALFYDVVEKLPAKHVTLVLDACFSGDSPAGALFKNISPARVKNITPIRDLNNSVVFSSADKDQVSTWYPAKRHSMFTYWFLKGLGGAADHNNDKSVTTAELQTYLSKEVTYWAQRESNRVQTPLVTGSGATVLAQLK